MGFVSNRGKPQPGARLTISHQYGNSPVLRIPLSAGNVIVSYPWLESIVSNDMFEFVEWSVNGQRVRVERDRQESFAPGE